jgi:hypothetical protein
MTRTFRNRVGRTRTHAALRVSALLACAVALVELLSFVPVGPLAGAVRDSTPAALPGTSAGSPLMAAAESSLQSGAGPAHGTPWDCSSPLSADAGVQCGVGTTSTPAMTMGPATPTWSLAAPPVPPARTSGAMVLDVRDGYVLLFSGYSPTGHLKDTWKFTGGRWTELSPATSPTVRNGAAIAFDAADNYVVLFGGAGGTVGLYDTWTWAAGVWTKLAPANHPTARFGATMAYDAKDGYVVLFGGVSFTLGAQSDTWKFLAGAWTKLTPAVHPSARFYAAMAYDAAASDVVLFGGVNSSILGDTWNFSGGRWTNLTASIGSAPAPRYEASLAYSAKDGELVLFGGETATRVLSDTWTFSGTNWTKISTYVHPSSRAAAMVADGPASGTVIVFGGVSGTSVSLNETWTFHGLVWTHSLPPQPAPRAAAMMTYDEADGYVLLFGGQPPGSTPFVVTSDTWKYIHGTWTELHPGVSPPPREAAMMTYDQADGYVVLFGGVNANGSSVFNDTWSFVGGVWTKILTANPPLGRTYASMTYDAADGYVLLFGGVDLTSYLNDTWAYSGGTWWEPVTSATAPEERDGASMAYDSEDGYVVLYGGSEAPYAMPTLTTWTYSAGVWTNITSTASNSPGFPIFGAMIDDTYDGYLLFVGGCANTFGCGVGYVANTTWSFVGGTWTQLSPTTSPGPIDFQAMAFDPPDNSVVLFGGENGQVFLGATWTY